MTATEHPRILIVDDSRTICTMLTRLLDGMGAAVESAYDGEAGLERASAERFDLVISDIEMPRMDGFELCRRLKEDPRTKSRPVIIMSVSDHEEDIARGFRMGASAYIVKSKLTQDLIPCVNDVLKRASLLQNKLFLVVDNSRLIRDVLSDSLLAAGFRVVCGQDGREGLALLDRHAPDIILSEVDLPVMDGAAFCRAVRGQEKWASVPFVAMSRQSGRRAMREMVQHGASAYLTKPFNIDELIILSEKLLSDHIQLLVKEKRLLVAEQEALLASIGSLVQALEARDSYTRGHSEAVREVAVGIGRAMGLGGRELERLGLAARLHDIGKIGIRDDILLKPGRLTAEEYAAIQRHPVIGAEILSHIGGISDLIPAILQHHERINGEGYPHGLRGEAITPFARIIAVADVFHALTSDRPYRGPLPRAKAHDILRRYSGDSLCPDCVAAFFAYSKAICDYPRAAAGGRPATVQTGPTAPAIPAEQAPVPTAAAPQGPAREPQSGPGDRKRIVDALLSCHEGFCSEIAERVAAAAPASPRGAAQAAVDLELVLAQLKHKHLEGVVKDLIRAIPTVLRQRGGGSRALERAIDKALSRFQQAAAPLFATMAEILGVAKAGRDLEQVALIDTVRVSALERFRREATEAFVRELGLEPAEDASGRAGRPEAKTVPLHNAFGRLLLTPLETYFAIGDVTLDSSASRPVFPRSLCTPILETIKTYLIGLENYNLVNASFMEALAEAYKKPNGFDITEVRVFLDHRRIRQYAAKYIFFLLNKLVPPERKETFVERVNYWIRSTAPNLEITFGEQQFQMLITAWVLALRDGVGLLKSPQAAAKVIDAYMSYLGLAETDGEQPLAAQGPARWMPPSAAIQPGERRA